MADILICPNCNGIQHQELKGLGYCICVLPPEAERSNNIIIFVFVLPLVLFLGLILSELSSGL